MDDRYPPARRLELAETLAGGRVVADPYRWLEDPEDPETALWSAGQDELWASWAAEHPERARLAEAILALTPGYRSAPLVIGERRFWTERAPGQDHQVLVVEDPAGVRTLVDPNALDAEATTVLDGWAPSIEGDRVAYLLSRGGDEESTLWVIDVETGFGLEGPIDRVRYSPLAWLPGGEELLYVRRLPPWEVPAGEEAFHRRLYRHQVRSHADTDDELLFGQDGLGPELDPTAYLGVEVSPDGRYVAVTVSLGTAPRNDLWVAALPAAGEVPRWQPALVGSDSRALPHLDRRGGMWIWSDLDAPRGRLLRADPASPGSEGWVEVLPEDPGAVLAGYVLAGEHLVAVRSRHGASEVAVHARSDGRFERQVELPGLVTADLSGRPDEGPEAWIGWTGWVSPYRVAPLDPATGQLGEVLSAPGAPAAPPEVEESVVTCTSADGTEVRMSVLAPAGRSPGTPVPTVLYGYGGFGIALGPSWTPAAATWVAAGGVWAVANLRGGSEEGEGWHRDGMRERKHHVFEDFEAAADRLVAGGWATPGTLAIMGGSNGGLLVGAALTRSPERYRAVVCSAPLLDMVRYELFGLGATWNDEYGTAVDPEQLGWLLSYSPYHHVQAGAAYPAVLFTVFDNDTRVDPLHARKLAAALQWATSGTPGERPILLRREPEVGHGARSQRRRAQLDADELAFLASCCGLDLDAR